MILIVFSDVSHLRCLPISCYIFLALTRWTKLWRASRRFRVEKQVINEEGFT